MGLESFLFGDYSKKAIKKIKPIADLIEGLADTYKAKTDAELRAMTDAFKERLASGETLDRILPEAFATAREAADRVLGKRPFYVQLLGGILLHQGRIAEMKTGEGKTLVATLPAYLNALTGNGVHIVTVNDYLAQRDAEEMGRIYQFLGLSTGVVLGQMDHRFKQQMYQCDIVYGTNTEFGFDYLRDNIAKRKEHLLQRGHAYCIIDEIDSILIDEARTPLIISGQGGEASDIFERCSKCARSLHPLIVKESDSKQENDDKNCDYIVEEKNSTSVMTARGVEKIEKFFGIQNLNDPENAEINHNMIQAIHAWGVMKKDVDYVVMNDEIIIVDKFTGRLMPGRRYQDGLHQAIEAKEGVNIKGDSRVVATVTIQNYFRMYKKLSGMTGTAKTEEDEFREIYGLDVVEVPTNKPMIRKDNSDRIYTNEKTKYNAIIRQVKACQEKGQPVLIGTASVEKSEKLGALLKAAGIKFNMLNAKDHAREAQVIAEAGMSGAVTLATNMAGRGTDIMLGGNPEMLARDEMRKNDKYNFTPEQIALSVCNLKTDDPVQLEANRVYRELYDSYREGIAKDREKVLSAGGLCIIGSERHESRRIDNQLRGRSGRQGDPGESTFYVSLTDDIMRLFGDTRMKRFAALSANLTDENDPDEGNLSRYLKILGDIIEKAQKNVEGVNFKRRKSVLQYDDILNEQRKQIYEQRNEILMDANVSEKIRQMIVSTAEESVANHMLEDGSGVDTDALYAKYLGWGLSEGELDGVTDPKEIAGKIAENSLALYEKRIADDPYGIFPQFEGNILLENVDELWLDHIDDMESLEQDVMLQSMAQRDPLNEYKIIGSTKYSEMIDEIRQRTVRQVLTRPLPQVIVRSESSLRNLNFGRSGSAPVRKNGPKPMPNVPTHSPKKVGPNDPCPCGSGKKYKKCCGAGASDN